MFNIPFGMITNALERLSSHREDTARYVRSGFRTGAKSKPRNGQGYPVWSGLETNSPHAINLRSDNRGSLRSEERRVGKEWRSRWTREEEEKKIVDESSRSS